MTFTKTLDDVADIVGQDDAGKWDAIVPAREVTLQHGRLWFPQATGEGHDMGLALSDWATSQACQRLGMPAGYFKRCPIHLQDAQFNHWAMMEQSYRSGDGDDSSTPSGSWLLRSKGATVRGVLSPRYQKLDNRQVLDSLLPVIRDSRYEVGLVDVSPEAFHLRLIQPNLWRDVLPDDRLFVGVHLTNSEVDLRAVTVDAVVWRLVCTNGLMHKVEGKSLLRQRHVRVEPARFLLLLEGAIAQATLVAAAFLEQMALSVRTPVPDIEGAVDYLAEVWNLPKQTAEYVKFGLLGEKQGDSLYGLVNAFTAAAQKLGIEERVELESLASTLIDTPTAGKGARFVREHILAPKVAPLTSV